MLGDRVGVEVVAGASEAGHGVASGGVQAALSQVQPRGWETSGRGGVQGVDLDHGCVSPSVCLCIMNVYIGTFRERDNVHVQGVSVTISIETSLTCLTYVCVCVCVFSWLSKT